MSLCEKILPYQKIGTAFTYNRFWSSSEASKMCALIHCNTDVLQQVDLDLGNYERFLDVTLTRDNNITTGKIYQVLINKHIHVHCVSHGSMPIGCSGMRFV